MRCHEIATLFSAMRAGAGIACLPALVVEGLTDVMPIAPGIVGRFDVYLSAHRDLRDRARVRSAFDFITRLFGQRSAILNGASVARVFGGEIDRSTSDAPERQVSADGSDR